MSLIARPGTQIDQIEAGNHHGVCVAVIDLGTQYNETFNKEQPKVMITWELPDFPLLNEHGNPDPDKGFRLISKEYTVSLHEKASLCIDLISWRGRAFTPDEAEAFNLQYVLGANCLVNVVSVQKNGKKYANVSAVAKLPKGMEPKTATYQLLYNMDDGIDAIPEGVPDWIANKIKKSREWIEHVGSASTQQSYDSPVVSNPDGEDIPF